METLAAIQSELGSGGVHVVGAVALTFMCVFFLVLALTDVLRRRADIRKRALTDRGYADDASGDGWGLPERSMRYQSVAATSALLGSVERTAGDPNQSETSKIRREVTLAGYFGDNAVLWYQSIRVSLLVVLPVVAYNAMQYFAVPWPPLTQLAVTAICAGLGFLVPSQYIRYRQQKMQQQCREGFPDFMDLMVICSEAGLNPRASIERISKEISHSYPYLGANLYLMSLELRAGATLHEAVTSLGKRVDLEEIFSLGTLLQQSEQFGTSLTDALRIYSAEMRDKRLARAEEKAHALPVKLVVPLGIFVFPAILVVILLPVLIRVKTALF